MIIKSLKNLYAYGTYAPVGNFANFVPVEYSHYAVLYRVVIVLCVV